MYICYPKTGALAVSWDGGNLAEVRQFFADSHCPAELTELPSTGHIRARVIRTGAEFVAYLGNWLVYEHRVGVCAMDPAKFAVATRGLDFEQVPLKGEPGDCRIVQWRIDNLEQILALGIKHSECKDGLELTLADNALNTKDGTATLYPGDFIQLEDGVLEVFTPEQLYGSGIEADDYNRIPNFRGL